MPNQLEDAPSMEAAKSQQILEYAVANRNFEIDLFWKRSLFFWGFIAVAFIGYSTLIKDSPRLACVLAAFGLVSSVAWCLANRGSKYWQEAWEQKVARAELSVIGTIHQTIEPVKDNGSWLQARRYSVTKLAIALSDFIAITWLFILVGTTLNVLGFALRDWWLNSVVIGVMLGGIAFSIVLLVGARSNLPKN